MLHAACWLEKEGLESTLCKEGLEVQVGNTAITWCPPTFNMPDRLSDRNRPGTVLHATRGKAGKYQGKLCWPLCCSPLLNRQAATLFFVQLSRPVASSASAHSVGTLTQVRVLTSETSVKKTSRVIEAR